MVHEAPHAVVEAVVVRLDEARVLEHGDAALALVDVEGVGIIRAEDVAAGVAVLELGPELLVVLDGGGGCLALDAPHEVLRLMGLGLVGEAHEPPRAGRPEVGEHRVDALHGGVLLGPEDALHEVIEDHGLADAPLVAEEEERDGRHVRGLDEDLPEPADEVAQPLGAAAGKVEEAPVELGDVDAALMPDGIAIKRPRSPERYFRC